MVTIRSDPDTLAQYETDESGIFRAHGLDAVYQPETESEVAELLAAATRERRLVTISGAGTGITGGRVAVHGGAVLATDHLTIPAKRDLPRLDADVYGRLCAVYLDDKALLAHVPAGISLDTLAALLPAHLIYPPDPTEGTALIGGTIATNASGARTFRYGPTREWVTGLRVVLANGDTVTARRGEVVATAGKLSFSADSGAQYEVPLPTYPWPTGKNAAGLYSAPDADLVDLFIGSEGILGVITEATLRLAPTPEPLIGQIAFFPTEEQALAFVDDLRKAAEAGELQVLSLEYFDPSSLEFMEHPLAQGKRGAAVAAEFAAGMDELDALVAALEEHGSVEDWFAESVSERQEQRKFRHSLPEGVNSYLRRHGSQKLGTDLVVPAERFRDLIAAYRAAEEAFAERFPRAGKHLLLFGHIGNYHLHANFITHNPEELAFAKSLYAAIARQAIAWGGTVSGEHGVGKKTVEVEGKTIPYLELMVGREGLAQIARAKRALDPALILNVGNIVPREYLDEWSL